MKNYIFYVRGYQENIGGCKICHRLCHILNELGYPAYIWTYSKISEVNTNPQWNTPVTNDRSLLKNSIVIYPEISSGNLLKAPYYVRWIMYYPKPAIAKTFQEDELHFYFSNKGYPKYEDQYRLFTLVPHDDFFVDLQLPREGTCFAIRKGEQQRNGSFEKVHPKDAFEIMNNLSLAELKEIFNRYQLFICYDLYCFLSNIAVMCGCLSVVVPHPEINKEEWIQKRGTYGHHGIAYGFDDLTNVQPELYRPYLKEIEQKSLMTIQNFIQLTQEKFKSINPMSDFINKIFIIGFNKCGTSSLSLFFEKNGYPSLHWIDSKKRYLAQQIQKNMNQQKPLLDGYDSYMVFSDLTYLDQSQCLEMNKHYQQFDQQYPNSKFILNIRPIDHWIQSRLNHNTRRGTFLERYQQIYKLTTTEQVIDQWTKTWSHHLQEVCNYFQGSDKLLVFDIENDSPEKIVDFFPSLKLDVIEYKHINKTKTSQQAGKTHQITQEKKISGSQSQEQTSKITAKIQGSAQKNKLIKNILQNHQYLEELLALEKILENKNISNHQLSLVGLSYANILAKIHKTNPVSLYRQTLQLTPNRFEIYFHLMHFYRQQKKWSAVIELIPEINTVFPSIDQNPATSRYWTVWDEISLAYYHTGQKNLAFDLTQKILKNHQIDPTNRRRLEQNLKYYSSD